MQPVPRQATCNQFRPIEPSFPLKAQVVNPKKGITGRFAAIRRYLKYPFGSAMRGCSGFEAGFRLQPGPRQGVRRSHSCIGLRETELPSPAWRGKLVK